MPNVFQYTISGTFIVMRHKRRLLVLVAVVAILGGILILASGRKQKAVPAARIILISYTNYTMNPPNTNIFVFPGRGSWISAKMILTNEGSVSISYGAWGSEPYGWANVETTQGKTNGYLAPPFTGGTAVLRPGQAITFSVTLPTNTLQWQCGFDVETASVRDRAIQRVFENRLYSKIPEICWYPIRLLPDKAGLATEVRSQLMDITNGTPGAQIVAVRPDN
jgi:hypothetical protein